MSLFILDTDVFSLYLRGHEHVCRRIVELKPDQLALTIVTVEESLTGWYSQIRRARRDEEILKGYASLHRTFDLLRDLPVLAFDARANRVYHGLRKSHRRIASNDLRIAAIVLQHAGILVTGNRHDFSGIPGLISEDWSKSLETD